MAAGHSDTFHHVRDFPHFELPFGMKLELPNLFGLQLTKFMVLQLVVCVISFLVFRGLSRRVAGGRPVTGRWWNFWEALALFIRDEVVRPTIGDGHHGHDDEGHEETSAGGGHPADEYLPFIWSCFFYVLLCNLLGAVPWLGSATGEINVTGVLAVTAFGATLFYGSRELGVGGFWLAQAPHIDVAGPLKLVLLPMIWVIEVIGLFIKHGVLCVRLFANIMAGHTVIAVILGFIAATSGSAWYLYYPVLGASIGGQIAIGMLELFVAFLQAYIFAFLATLFISMAIHPH
ncbi:MAG: ATP synthase F0 subunit A [Planctomycetaceae bacterium]|jgi:F-type H+-transporting ATPase subunit a|nr:ATP synthase F0 subunit A [Planctomycetaceae bacterium]MDP7278097.1 F0F1 ATP synthase subunit A [Planctomycetaceae bacterium]